MASPGQYASTTNKPPFPTSHHSQCFVDQAPPMTPRSGTPPMRTWDHALVGLPQLWETRPAPPSLPHVPPLIPLRVMPILSATEAAAHAAAAAAPTAATAAAVVVPALLLLCAVILVCVRHRGWAFGWASLVVFDAVCWRGARRAVGAGARLVATHPAALLCVRVCVCVCVCVCVRACVRACVYTYPCL